MDFHGLPFDKLLNFLERVTPKLVRVYCEDVRHQRRKRRQWTYDGLRETIQEKRRVMIQLGRYEELAEVDQSEKLLNEYQAALDATKRETTAEKQARLLAGEHYEELARLLKRKKRAPRK
jgi:uncharacterized sporulation protein YeaH/YhbH (DUF444 family)